MIIDKSYVLNKLLKILMSMNKNVMLRHLDHNGENLDIFQEDSIYNNESSSQPNLNVFFKTVSTFFPLQ